LQALAQQAQAIEDYMAAGGDEAVEERPMAAPVDPYADIDPELLGGEVLSVSCRGWLLQGVFMGGLQGVSATVVV
jgi:hypothetical protein